jgi:two-component system heavy metal sensor histidine kinase CusS
MSLTKQINGQIETPVNPRRRQPLELAWRLTIAYAIATCLLLLVAAGLMYYELVASIKSETALYLSDEIRDMRAGLRQPMATPLLIRQGLESNAPSDGDAFPTYQRVLDFDGSMIGETPDMTRLLPAGLFPTVAADDLSQSAWRVVKSAGPGGEIYQIGTAAVAGPNDNHYFVQVALALTEENKLLNEYRARIWVILVPSLLAAVLASYGLAHSGLRPLRQVVRAVRRVESTTLDQRIDSSGFSGELAKLAGSFNDMLGRIEDAFGRLNRFSADIAHELRTPIGCIRGEMEVALGKARSPEEYREVLGSCLEECLRLSHLIDRLLFLARAEREEAMLRLETVDLDKELRKVREFYEAGAAEGGVALLVHADPGLTARIDRTLLQSALGNLIENAIAHTPSGGSVKLNASQENGEIRLEVLDTGCGISAEHLPFVLDRFYRADGARGRQGGHAGLGLAIVKSIAALHGGQVEIASTVGEGTAVRVVLPAVGG